jgi:hypothetical protein
MGAMLGLRTPIEKLQIIHILAGLSIFPFFLTIHFGVTHGTWKPRSAEDYLFSKSIGTLNPPRFGAILGAKQLRPGRDMRGAFSTGEACAGYVPHQLCFLFNLCTAKRIVSYMR